MHSILRLSGLVAAAVALAPHAASAHSLRRLDAAAAMGAAENQHGLQPWQPPPSDRTCTAPTQDTDYEGHDFKNITGRQADLCCGECTKTDGCIAWSWNSDNGGTCWLKSERGQQVKKSGVVSAYVLAGEVAELPYEENIDYEGNDITNKPGDVTSCAGLCKLEPRCKAWSWNTDNFGTCWLKSAKGNAVHKPDVVSGTVPGYAPP